MPKSTNIELNERISIVAEMIIKGYSRENILRYSAENWNIQERMTDEYIARAHESFVHEAKAKEVEHHLNLTLQRLSDLYKKSYAIQDYAECRRIEKDKAELLGINAPKKIDQSVNYSFLNIDPLADDPTDNSVKENSQT